MTDHQADKKRSYNVTQNFVEDPANTAVWAGFHPLENTIIQFEAECQNLEILVSDQDVNTKGYTEDKSTTFKTLVTTVVIKSNLAYIWAEDNNDNVLKELFHVSHNTLQHTTEDKAFTRIAHIRNAIHDNIAALTAAQLLTTADVTEIDSQIAAYKPTIDQSTSVLKSRKVVTTDLVTLFTNIDKTRERLKRLIVGKYTTTHPSLVQNFLNTLEINDSGHRYTGIHVHCTAADTNTDLSNVTCEILKTGKKATTDLDGVAEIISVKSGTYEIRFTHPNYQSQTLKTKLIRARIIQLDITMNPDK